MNIKVITRHAPSNYGSLLQAIATQTILERLGHRCEIIDYVRSDERGLRGVITALNGKKDWKDSFLKKLVYVSLRYPDEKVAEMKFDRMRRRYLNLTKRCCTSDDLSKLDADIFMTGSDQVWGPTLSGVYDEAYFLAFAGHNDKKVAYAASFGRTGFTDAELSKYKALLSGYSAITVREDSAVLDNYLRVISDHSMFLSRKINEFALQTLSDRILGYIKRHGALQNLQDTAFILGVARPSLSRAVSQLVSQGVLRKSDDGYVMVR